MNEFFRHPKILKKDKTALLVIDVQEKILKVMPNSDKLLDNILKLVKGFKNLGVPIFYSEQYPQGLGPTVEVLSKEIDKKVFEKITFSCTGAENLFNKFIEKNITQLVLCGIESHVCVFQTAMDLLANNFQVNIPANAVSSRFEIDYNTAIRRLEKNGAEITTVESVLFELLENCKVPEFKFISNLVKN